VNNHRYKQREGVAFVCFEDVEEVIVLEKAHGSISHLQM